MPDLHTPNGSILHGDVSRLKEVPDGYFQCCVTSPPYYKLRSYLPTDHPDKKLEIGSEPTPELYIENLINTFRLVRQKMHKSGLLFLNIGDKMDGGVMNLPHLVAESLRADGWYWVQTIVWQKLAPLPESMKGWRWERCRKKTKTGLKDRVAYCEVPDNVAHRSGSFDTNHGSEYIPCPGCSKCKPNDGWIHRAGSGRCTNSYEYIFVMAKSSEYFWNSAEFLDVAVSDHPAGNKTHKYADQYEAEKHESQQHRTKAGLKNLSGVEWATKNPRSVWTIASEPSKKKHWASYPSEIPRRAITAGTSSGGCCPVCRTPFSPMVESEQVKRERPSDRTDRHAAGEGVNSCGNTVAGVKTNIVGYRPSCSCGVATSVPCAVLDIFAGTGTTAQVAQWMGRDWLLTELYDQYIEICKEKIFSTPPRCAVKKAQKKSRRKKATAEKPVTPLPRKPTRDNRVPLPGQKELL